MKYKVRLSDEELKRKLNASGAVLIQGPKACGKTESAKQLAKSVLCVPCPGKNWAFRPGKCA